MGYHTEFSGHFTLDKRLTEEHFSYLRKFSETRRMKRNAVIADTFPDPVRRAVGLPIGKDGAYFVGGSGYRGQDNDESIVEYNHPPSGQPSLWCNWVPETGDDFDVIEWSGAEKFYDYVEWLEYLIKHFLEPWGYTLNGEVEWQGEERGDIGLIVVEDNAVSTRRGSIVYYE